MKYNKIRDLDAPRRAALERLRKPVSAPSLTVGDLVFCGGAYATVTCIYTYAPWTHDDSPIRNDWKAVEVITDNGTRWTGREPETATQSGYTHCACRDCMDVAMSSNVSKPELCSECKDAGCVPIAPYNERIQFCSTYECQRDDAYGEA